MAASVLAEKGSQSNQTPLIISNGSKPIRPKLIQDAFDKNKPIYYFGLGSNMSRKKLENRGINGTKIEVKSFEAAVVPNYRLAFNMRGFPPLEPGMGSLEPTSCSINDEISSKPLLAYHEQECHGALALLTPENYEKVARSEGITGNLDQGYDEIIVEAFPYNKRKPVQAVAFRARSHVRLAQDPSPSKRYMNILREGAEELGLKPCYQEFLAKHPVQNVGKFQKQLAIYNLVFTIKMRGKRRFSTANTPFIVELQRKLLSAVYLPSSSLSNSVLHFLSQWLTNLILFPGAFVGFIMYLIMEKNGSTPPMLKRFMEIFANSE